MRRSSPRCWKKVRHAVLDGISTICKRENHETFGPFPICRSDGDRAEYFEPKHELFLILTEHFLWLNLTKTKITTLSQHKVHAEQKVTYSFQHSWFNMVYTHFKCQHLLWLGLGGSLRHKP